MLAVRGDRLVDQPLAVVLARGVALDETDAIADTEIGLHLGDRLLALLDPAAVDDDRGAVAQERLGASHVRSRVFHP